MADSSGIRLNKYLAHGGVASRRVCGDLVKAGKVKVNGKTELNPSYMVQKGDMVTYQGRTIKPIQEPVYLLMNKPKSTLTTTSDDRGRKTVMDLLKEDYGRIYPVGRLDRETTGLLLLTNDGDLAQKLAHPSFEIKKVYHVELFRPVTEQEIRDIRKGLTLEDGSIKVDDVGHIKASDPHRVSIALHSGRNRIIRRIFEHLGHRVKRLDRVYYAGLTKKDLPRGRYRHLRPEELRRLKYFNKL